MNTWVIDTSDRYKRYPALRDLYYIPAGLKEKCRDRLGQIRAIHHSKLAKVKETPTTNPQPSIYSKESDTNSQITWNPKMESGILGKNLESLIKWNLDKCSLNPIILVNYTADYPMCCVAISLVL